jgi:hypothetical protein
MKAEIPARPWSELIIVWITMTGMIALIVLSLRHDYNFPLGLLLGLMAGLVVASLTLASSLQRQVAQLRDDLAAQRGSSISKTEQAPGERR